MREVAATDAPSILCVHPNRELYGSDRTFLQSVRALRERWPAARITVVLPGPGPLSEPMAQIVEDIRYQDIFVLRRSEFGPQFLLRLPALIAAVRRARRAIAAHDLTYINTVVVLDHLLASRLQRKRVFTHVHELPTGVTRIAFSALLWLSRSVLVYISDATRRGFRWLDAKPAVIVWNGTRAVAAPSRPVRAGPLQLLLIGRFNAWKGQPVLLDALALLEPEERARLAVRLVGSVYEGQDHFADAISERVERLNLRDCVTVMPFTPDPAEHYRWADVVAVPSTEPEPFGLVAIEAMAAGCAVVAAGHGGLAEIVVDGVTGTHVTPGSPAALAAAIRRYLADPALAVTEGRAGQARFAECFDERIYMRRIADVAATMLAGHAPAPIAQGN